MRVAIGPSSFAEKSRKPLEILETAGIEVVPNPFGRRLTEEEIIELLSQDIDGLIAGLEPLNRTVLDSVKGQLKALARVGIGMNNVDQDAAKEFGIKVSNTPDGPTSAVAEMTITAMLSLIRRLPQMNSELHKGAWNKIIGDGMTGLPVMFIGYGRIGRQAGKLARAFGADVMVCDPFLKPEDLTNGERLVGLDEGLAQANVITLHASGAEPILTAAEFAKAQDGVVILNSARGELVDEAALVAALESGKVGGGWFDAFVKEPYSGPLTRFDNILLTPHTGTYTLQCRLSMESSAVENLLRDLGVS